MADDLPLVPANSAPMVSALSAPDSSLHSGPQGAPDDLVPVRYGSQVGTVPVKDYHAAVAAGAVPLSEEEWNDHQAKLMAARQAALEQEQYGHISNQLAAAGVGALESVPLAGPAAIAAIGHATGSTEYLRKSAEANPVARGAGVVGGIVVPAILSGGGTAVEEGAAQGLARGAAEAGGEALARGGAEAAAEAATPVVGAAHEAAQATQAAQAATPGAARLAGQVFSAPQHLVTRVGEGVEKAVASMLPEEATTLAGKLALKAATMGARGAGEGLIYGASDYAAQQALSADPEFDAEKLMAEIGHATLLGGLTGGALGAGGALSSHAIGKLAPVVSEAADHQLFRAVTGKGRTSADVRDLASMEGGWRGVVQTLREKGAIHAGDDITAIADRLEHVDPITGVKTGIAKEAGEALGEHAAHLDDAHVQGPRIADIKKHLDEELGAAMKDPDIDKVQIGRLEDIKRSLEKRAQLEMGLRLDTPELAAKFLQTPEGRQALERLTPQDRIILESGEVPTALKDMAKAVFSRSDARLSFAEARDFRKKIAGEVAWNKVPGTGAVDKTGQLYQRATAIIEDEITKAAESGVREAGEKMGANGERLIPENWVSEYKQKKLEYQRLKVASRAAQRGKLAKLSQAQVGLAGYAGLIPGAVIGAVHGSVPGALMGLASGIAAKTVKERGASTSGVLLDRLSTLGALQQVSAKGDMKIAKGAKAILSGAKVAVKTPRHGLDSFEDKAAAVKAAEENPQGHLESLQRAAASIMPHAPQTGSALVSAALRATTYLSSFMPRGAPLNPAMPNAGRIEPSAHEKFVFAKVVDAVDNPHSVIAAASAGTLLPQQVAAMKATSPKVYAAYMKELAKEQVRATNPTKADRALMVSMLTGKPATPAMMQQNIAMQQGAFPQPDGKADKPVGGTSAPSRGIPKASKLSFASQATLGGPSYPGSKSLAP